MRNQIDEKLIEYSVFKDSDLYLGSATVQLPNMQGITTQIKGAGIGGEFESITPGYFSSMTMSLKWRTAPEPASVILMEPVAHLITFRGVIQRFDKAAINYFDVGKKITVKAFTKNFDMGQADNLATMDASTELEVLYIKSEEDGKVLFEVDKLNNIYVVNGKDWSENRRRMLGL
ncbi:phage major tail tube protein [Paenibacillus melissococcoides]|uniref:Phage major tail tube protein n=1 Tax=Paenibacillus melissococcoides TaxID=2912268 RepID=A0ABM9FWV1_9BACL|nr:MULTISPECIES: phage major tail tube protein [Paenibacillus]MEB9895943.1 phage major tail tube protein [Bacillus cereus]QVQ56214.1 major tail tube protein [Paenibacillus phage Pd_22F]CAH8243632.1 phage major tail tube protein [Paenibacillus melissococcoides]CAH8247459.1 phage major tail tube protein [Paenibacillus melissococcoides]CAH8248536.1 phage major tail tube protein [Paenibacillus melissococcoides]